MNWKQIEANCPKAQEKMKKWWWTNYDNDYRYSLEPRFDILYEFFDEQRLYIDVSMISLRWHIWDKNRENVPVYKYYTKESRQEMEKEAFEKAFEILEERLENEN